MWARDSGTLGRVATDRSLLSSVVAAAFATGAEPIDGYRTTGSTQRLSHGGTEPHARPPAPLVRWTAGSPTGLTARGKRDRPTYFEPARKLVGGWWSADDVLVSRTSRLVPPYRGANWPQPPVPRRFGRRPGPTLSWQQSAPVECAVPAPIRLFGFVTMCPIGEASIVLSF